MTRKEKARQVEAALDPSGHSGLGTESTDCGVPVSEEMRQQAWARDRGMVGWARDRGMVGWASVTCARCVAARAQYNLSRYGHIHPELRAACQRLGVKVKG